MRSLAPLSSRTVKEPHVGRSNKMSVQKRARERKKAEQAELKRTRRRADTEEVPRGGQVADRADLESYGVPSGGSDSREDR